MAKFEFTIIASGFDPETDEAFEDRFFEAGCDDATLSYQKGAIVLEFNRDDETFARALASAVGDVKKAGAHVERIEPDHLVSLSDIADRAGMSKAAISLYVKGERAAHFPAPVARVMTDSPLWNWVDVATWLYRYKDGNKDVAVRAHLVWKANLLFALGSARLHLASRASFSKYLKEQERTFEEEKLGA